MIMHPLGRVAALLFFMATIPALLLQGCIPLAITAAGGTALVATDRRSTGAQLDDEIIEDKIVATVVQRFKGGFHVNATSYNGIVLLTGEVPAEGAKADIGEIARTTPKVRAVQNDLVIGAVTNLGSRSNDTLITSKVKARFVEATSSRSIMSRS